MKFTALKFSVQYFFQKEFVMNEKKKESLYAMIEAAIMLALTMALDMFAVIRMPYGGSVTICSLLPIIALSYRRGLKWGFGTGFVFGLLSMILGLDNLAYIAKDFGTLLIFFVFDYFLACTVLGFGGIFRNIIKRPYIALPLGALVATSLRFLSYVISGFTIWRQVADYPTASLAALWYSITYNASYMIPEIIITVVAAGIVAGVVDLRKKRI